MSHKKESCPLCGCEMTAIETYPGRGELYCGKCDVTIGGNEAKTPEELTALMDGSRYKQLEAENEKLRELAVLTHRYIAESCAVQYPFPPKPVSYLCQLEVEDRMRELGIEVDA